MNTNRMLKKVASVVLSSSKSSTGTRPPHHSAARTNLVLLIRRTVRPWGYASGFDSPAALLDNLFEHPAGGYCFFERVISREIDGELYGQNSQVFLYTNLPKHCQNSSPPL